jgi:hypothetical protein
MRNLVGRIDKLEQRMGLGIDGGLGVIVMKAGQSALDTDQCIQIVEDSGYVLPRPIALLRVAAARDRNGLTIQFCAGK